jgi:DNA-binding ferritin-like protein
MINKERLGEIKSRVWKDEATYADGDNKSREGHTYTLSDYDYEWLIKQAERVEELELEVSDWRAEVQKWQKFYKESEESHSETKELLKSIVNQNKRYREALKNIYELAEYDEYDNTLEQIVSEIEKALESDEN